MKISLRGPVDTWQGASHAVGSRMEADPPDISVEEVTLTLSGLTGEHGTRMELFDKPHGDRDHRIVETENRLRDRPGGVDAL